LIETVLGFQHAKRQERSGNEGAGKKMGERNMRSVIKTPIVWPMDRTPIAALG
jgi:hypothetical protein